MNREQFSSKRNTLAAKVAAKSRKGSDATKDAARASTLNSNQQIEPESTQLQSGRKSGARGTG